MPKSGIGFFDKVYDVVKRIPRGKVITYGQVANVLGTKDARKIGWALHANKLVSVPCHRVVNKLGGLAKNFAFDGWREQKHRLENEGVVFVSNSRVDLDRCRYIFKT